MEKYLDKIHEARTCGVPSHVPLYAANRRGVWVDPDSPTGYSQVCSYYSICQSPCNGDC